MIDLSKIQLEKDVDTTAIEESCRSLWDSTGVYRYDPNAQGVVFSVDTPPPYVSAAHLHVGHAMSYAQAEFIVRYQRMKGRQIFYPMGFDDNGLPTERFVEKTYHIDKRKTSRSAFRSLCLEETKKGAAQYEELWRALGLSVDWRLRYSTIDDHCQKTAQTSFIDLYKKGRIYRSSEPVLWDPQLETALAQADLETIERKSELHEIVFRSRDGAPLHISTTRPELLAGCVALYCNAEDDRYKSLIGGEAIVPLFGHSVPILADREVLPEFGTGLMMVCTFGDSDDVKRWKRDGLALRACVGPDGRMTQIAGKFAGLSTEQARRKIVAELKEAGLLERSQEIEQHVSVSERSGAPVEFVITQQWFIRVLDLKEAMLERSAELHWSPEWMKARLDDWIHGLKYDWNISRQRFYGVPFPVWYCEACNSPVIAPEELLPVDPLESPASFSSCPSCGGSVFRGDPDVMDTWMTSSLTPLINANWVGSAGKLGDMSIYPMALRVQAFEIIRTWLFYTVLKSHLHTNSLPWRDVMISGWGLNEHGKKISKRDLEKFTDASGFNRYEPYAVVRKYGADSLRYWAAGSQLGNDLRYNEGDVKVGRKLVIKLWNAARYCLLQWTNFDPCAAQIPVHLRTIEDRWLIRTLQRAIGAATHGFESYNYALAREATDRFFWDTFCDDYLEIVKARFWTPERYSDATRQAAQITMWECFRSILLLYAPFVPFITEHLYQRIYRPFESSTSIHTATWPVVAEDAIEDLPEMNILSAILRAVRSLRSQRRISQTRSLGTLVLDIEAAASDLRPQIRSLENSLQAVARVQQVSYSSATEPTDIEGVLINLLP
ncbi:MAG TPA: valine--tRNA ligase [Bryobacteraceae bacterium]|nr:valine--tRNA ligase [Bryobacteraceae bacterium]